jgi:endonuclease G
VTPLKLTVRVEAPLAVAPAAAPASAPGSAAPVGFEAISIDPDYGNREGYDPEFLGGENLRVPLPSLSPAQKALAARVEGAEPGEDPHELRYHHFSVVMNRARRLAFFTAVNIDGRLRKPVDRAADRWVLDPRLGPDAQVGNEWYGRPFDRGHLVRRLDPTWGRSPRVAKVANDDTFHFTNCSPQHFRFNEGKNLWAGLEDYLLAKAAGERRRMTVFTGPVFAEDDPEFRGVRIPRRFWKVAVIGPVLGLSSLAFLVSQEGLLRDAVSFGPSEVAQLFQTSVLTVEATTGLTFGALAGADAGSVTSFAPGPVPLRELHSLEEIGI